MTFREHLSGSSGVLASHAAPPTVFVIDPDLSVRNSLQLLISRAGWRLRILVSAEEFIVQPTLAGPCCLVSDLRLPGLSGLELQARLAAQPDIPLIFLASHFDVSMTVRAMKAGAVDILVKPFSEDTLLAAIRQGLERSRVALDHQMELRDVRYCYDSLSSREQQVMALVVSGLLNKQIAGRLGIAEITVKRHRGRVMRKMGADSLPVLVHIGATLGLARPQRRNRLWEWSGSSSAVRTVGSPLQMGA